MVFINDVRVGQIVRSKAGRDKGKYFVIIDKVSSFIYLVDGDIRKVESPKKKNVKHVQKTNTVISEEKILLNNREVRNGLEDFLNAEN